jgi:hypothetical protein
MTQRKRMEGSLASWHPHPKEAPSLAPVVTDAPESDAPEADDLDHRFFDGPAQPEVHDPLPVAEMVETAARQRPVDSPAVRARRRYLTRYVAGAVGVAGLIGLAALLRVAVSRDASADVAWNDTSLHAPATMAASLPAPATPAEEPAAAQPANDPAPPANDPSPAAVDAPPVASAEPPQPAAAEPAPPAAAADSTDAPPDPKAAAEAKVASTRALDRGHVADSIAAGERSVALDPRDADAWLVLGAAYQQAGRLGDARRAFSSCAHLAKRGARSECGALLR